MNANIIIILYSRPHEDHSFVSPLPTNLLNFEMRFPIVFKPGAVLLNPIYSSYTVPDMIDIYPSIIQEAELGSTYFPVSDIQDDDIPELVVEQNLCRDDESSF
jgi:hypothetical protein